MITYKTNDNKKLVRFTKCDVTILFLISMGASSCSDIADVMGKTKQAISAKVEKLTTLGIVNSLDVPVRGRYKEYSMTPRGKLWLNNLLEANAILYVA